MINKNLLLGLFCLSSLCSHAQFDADQELRRIARPQCFVDYVTDDHGTRLLPRKLGSQETAPLKAKGTPVIPVMLVEFADRPFYASGKTHEEVVKNFDIFFNSDDHDLVKQMTNSYGSIASYFDEMSHGQFKPSFQIIGPITLDNGYAYYGKDTSEKNKDGNISSFYREAASKAVKEFDVDWNVFDNDGNGSADLLFIIYAGWGQNTVQEDADAIWPKEGRSSFSVTTDDGKTVKFGCYGVTSEARFKSVAQLDKDLKDQAYVNGYNPDNLIMDGVGVCIHELSHALGLPDFYDINYVGFGMDMWSVMDYGEYGQNGFIPTGYNAYERNFMGWEALPTLTEPAVVTIPCFADAQKGDTIAYKVVNKNNENEYYVLENRQGKGWDRTLANLGHGLQVTHVDYVSNRWSNNTVNTDIKHQLMTIISAANNYNGANEASSNEEWFECLAGCLYPGSSFNYNLTDESTPAAEVWNGSYMSQPIRNITENEDGTITFCFRTNGKLEVPVLNDPEGIHDTDFKATWGEVENATRYAIQLEDEDAGQLACDTLNVNERTFTDLRSSARLKYRVKALADSPEDYIESDWSEYTYLTTTTDIMSNVADSDKMVMVYALNGMPVSHCQANELYRIDLRPGIYVMKYQNGETRKIIIK